MHMISLKNVKLPKLSHTEPTEEPSASRESSKKEEDVEYIVEDDDNEDDDDDNDNDDVVDEDKPQYVKKRCGKPVPVELQNPKRFYCKCGRSYTHASDLNRHKLEECGQTGRKHWVCPKCPKRNSWEGNHAENTTIKSMRRRSHMSVKSVIRSSSIILTTQSTRKHILNTVSHQKSLG